MRSNRRYQKIERLRSSGGTVASSAMAPEGRAPPAAGPSSASASSARPSRAGAKQAAQRTVDKIEERQRELEKALDDQD